MVEESFGLMRLVMLKKYDCETRRAKVVNSDDDSDDWESYYDEEERYI